MLDTDVLFEHERVRKNTGTSTAPVSEAHWSTYSRLPHTLPHMWHEPRLANCSYAWSRILCGVTRTVHPDIFRDTSFSTFFRGLVQNTKSRGQAPFLYQLKKYAAAFFRLFSHMFRRGDEKKYYRCEISGFDRGVNRSPLFWDVTQRRLIVSHVSGRPIGHIFRGQADRENSSQTSWLLKVGPIGCPRNVGNYQSTLRNIPEERRPEIWCWGKTALQTFQYLLSVV